MEAGYQYQGNSGYWFGYNKYTSVTIRIRVLAKLGEGDFEVEVVVDEGDVERKGRKIGFFKWLRSAQVTKERWLI